MSLYDVDVNHSNLLSDFVNVKSSNLDLWVEHLLIITKFFQNVSWNRWFKKMWETSNSN